MSSNRNTAAVAAAAAAAVLVAACGAGPQSSPVASTASGASAVASSPAAQGAATSQAAAPAGSPVPTGQLTMKQAQLAYVRIVGRGNALSNKLAGASTGSAPFSEFRTDALAYARELRAEIAEFRAIRWPAGVRTRINAMTAANFPADISCLQTMAAASSMAAAQAVGGSNHDCMAADNSTIPGTLQSMLSQ
jgi:hypothetical protein